MKKNIHPKWVESQVVCACGNSFVTRSVKPALRIEVCSRCHPFFTGQQRIVDTAGRVERFMQRIAAKQEEAPSRKQTAKKAMRRGRYAGPEGLAVVAEEEEVAAEREDEEA